MSEELRGVVLGHGGLARALVEAAERISGVTGALVPVTNDECDRSRLVGRLEAALDDRPALVFTDLPSGSCFVAAMSALGARDGVRVVTGVNLTMLLDFVFHRTLPLDEAAARAEQVGARAIASR